MTKAYNPGRGFTRRSGHGERIGLKNRSKSEFHAGQDLLLPQART
jgi:hypothetical protein